MLSIWVSRAIGLVGVAAGCYFVYCLLDVLHQWCDHQCCHHHMDRELVNQQPLANVQMPADD